MTTSAAALFVKKSQRMATSTSEASAAGTSEASVSRANTPYPSYKEYFIVRPEDCLPSRINTVEQNFFILQRNKGHSRTSTCRAMCAFCAHSFQCMSITKMRVHLTGETEGDCRVEKCAKVPIDCRTFYQTERDTKATEARQKRSLQIERIRDTITSSDVQVSMETVPATNQRLLLRIPVY